MRALRHVRFHTPLPKPDMRLSTHPAFLYLIRRLLPIGMPGSVALIAEQLCIGEFVLAAFAAETLVVYMPFVGCQFNATCLALMPGLFTYLIPEFVPFILARTSRPSFFQQVCKVGSFIG